VKRNLDHLPLVVLTAGRSEWPNCFPPEVKQRLDQAWQNMQEELVHLSSNSAHVVAKDSGHCIACDQPEAVIDAIRRVVAAVRNGGGVSNP